MRYRDVEYRFDLLARSGFDGRATGAQPDFGVVVFERVDQHVAGHPAARLVNRNEGQTAERQTAADWVAGMPLLNPVLHEAQVESEIAKTIEGASTHSALKTDDRRGDVATIGAHQLLDAREVITSRHVIDQRFPDVWNHRGTGLGTPRRYHRARHRHQEQREHQQAIQAQEGTGDRERGEGHRASSRFKRATSSMGPKGLTT